VTISFSRTSVFRGVITWIILKCYQVAYSCLYQMLLQKRHTDKTSFHFNNISSVLACQKWKSINVTRIIVQCLQGTPHFIPCTLCTFVLSPLTRSEIVSYLFKHLTDFSWNRRHYAVLSICLSYLGT